MKIYSETSLKDFEFWAGAVDTVKELTEEQLDTIEGILEDIYPDGMDEVQVNDLFWFDNEIIDEWLGIESSENMESEEAQ